MPSQHHKTICIINTGGTIGMKPTDKGFAPVKGYLSEQLNTLSELQHPDMPQFDIIEFDPLIDSADATIAFWNTIGQTIYDHHQQYDGFVVLHGTDTMAYTASALSFMLGNLSTPVLITGAQVPIACIPSDARSNVVDALYLASHDTINEVCIYFSHTLYRGNRATKISAIRYTAFDSPNYPVLGTVSSQVDIHHQHLLPAPNKSLQFTPFSSSSIALIPLFPGITHQLISTILDQPIQALILQSYGTGNAPSDPALLQSLAKANEAGVIIINCTQCPHGYVKSDRYATGQSLAKAGAISAKDMTIEATIAKLTYLFTLQLSNEAIKTHMHHNLCGEIMITNNLQ